MKKTESFLNYSKKGNFYFVNFYFVFKTMNFSIDGIELKSSRKEAL